MPIAVDPEKTFDYILKRERSLPIEQQTIFHLKVLTARELAGIEDNVSRINTADGSMTVKTGSTILDTLKKGLRGWENFKDAQGNAVLYRENNGVPRDDNFDRLLPADRRELANAITEQNRLTEEQIKNSESGQESAR